ncbi:MAG: histidinol-phosphate transaminase [Prevotellaceae bacterium]|jgi:histidinol-phosphate aminotransferase|nr:histidinol-phosphate transaminase [Prevotellaceae bacterium]
MLTQLIRKNILQLQPYVSARDEYQGEEAILLDANENPYDNGCNRYPDPRQKALKEKIAEIKGIDVRHMILGNGSDEIIDLLIRSTCRPNIDNIIVFSPGYSMYEVSAAVNEAEVRKINLTADFLPDTKALSLTRDAATKIIVLCSPNNPTGNITPLPLIADICRENPCLVVVDEAYIDFTDAPSALTLLDKYPNLVVLQTLSKSWGMAGLRLGVGYADKQLIDILNRVKAPYNISSLSQKTALSLLAGYDTFTHKIETLKRERTRLFKAFATLGIFTKIYPSEANFILVTTEKYRELYDFLITQKIVVRIRHIPPLIEYGIRISVGTEEENAQLLEALTTYKTNIEKL